MSFYEDLVLALEKLPAPIAMDVIILGCWNIWSKRNGKIFRMEVPTLSTHTFLVKKDLLRLGHRVKSKNFDCFRDGLILMLDEVV